jgi:L-alanine-DL-glutamate epimerase-like enolase superfamily enzyme
MSTISTATAYALSNRFSNSREFDFEGGTRRIFKRDAILVEVETTDGLVGYAPVGASSSAMREYFEDATQDNLTDVLNTIVAPEVEGKSTEDPEQVTGIVANGNLPSFLRSQAASAINIALYDLKGKRHGVPAYELLCDKLDIDGEPRTELPMYASGGMYMPPEQYLEEAKSLRDAGFKAYKYRPGRGIDEDIRTFELLVDGVGDDMDIMIDAHTWWKMENESYTPNEVCDIVRKFADGGVYWVEEPVAPDDYDGYRRLAESTDAPLAGGENAESADELIELAETGAIDYLQGDVRHHEGYTGCLDAVRYCQTTDVTFIPHNFGTDLGLVANAHLVAATPETPYLECPVYETAAHAGMYPYELSTDILSTSLDRIDGTLTLPDAPGLGVEVNLDVVDEYPYVEGPWTEFIYS